MSVPAFLALLIGVCVTVVFVWWIMLKALTSKKPMHKGPLQNASAVRERRSAKLGAADHADDHHDDWHDDLHHETAVEAEWEQTEVIPAADAEIRHLGWHESTPDASASDANADSSSDSGSSDSSSSSDT
jgi:hypothetical protein